MKRRDFLVRSAGAALLGAVPFGIAAASRGSLLDDPLAWIGTAFRTADGAVIELAQVEQLACDRTSTQVRLHFRALFGAVPGEGTHTLASSRGKEMLYLQSGREGPVACLNRLRSLA